MFNRIWQSICKNIEQNLEVDMQYVRVITMVQSSWGKNIEKDLKVYMQHVRVITMV
jgi:hypothetical protein